MSRSRNDDDATRERLSDAVFTTLAELGPGRLTLRAVAAQAGCTTGLVLHAFPTKQALLLHARDVLHQRTKQRADLLEAGASDPEAAVRAIALGALPTDAEKLAEARVWAGFLAAALSDDVLREHHARNSRAFTKRLTRLLDTTPKPAAATAAVRAAILAAAVEGIGSLAAGDPEQWPAAKQHAALDVVLDAVL